MKLITTTSALSKRFGLKNSIRMIKEFGFDGYDCDLSTSMSPGNPLALTAYLEYAKEVREFSDKINFSCTQTHAPMPKISTPADVEEALPRFIKAIEISSILGAETVVVHPVKFTTVKEDFDLLYSKLLPYAKMHNVTIAAENIFRPNDNKTGYLPDACGTPEEFVEFIDCASNKHFTACLDTGHANLENSEPPQKFIRALGKDRLGALHIHDNNGIADQHTIPFNGTTNWDEVCRALAEIDYQGNFTLETDGYESKQPDELIPSCYALIEKTARHLMNKIECYKKEMGK